MGVAVVLYRGDGRAPRHHVSWSGVRGQEGEGGGGGSGGPRRGNPDMVQRGRSEIRVGELVTGFEGVRVM